MTIIRFARRPEAFVLGLALLSTVPLLWPPIPPIIDLPGNLGRYRVMAGTDAAMLDQWFRFAWRPIGYLGVDTLVAALSPALGIEPAAKLAVLLIPALTTVGMLWISHEAHGRVEPTALLAVPLAYGLPFQFGMVNYSLSIGLALSAFGLWLRWGRQRRWWLRAACFLPISGAIWAAHLFGLVVFSLLAGAAELMRERNGGHGWPAATVKAGFACLPLAPAAAAVLLGWRPSGSAADDWWAGLPLKLGWIATALRDRWRWLDVSSMTVLALTLYHAARSRDWNWSRPLVASALALLILFVALPFGSAYADARIAPVLIAMAVLAIGGPADATARRRWFMLSAAFFAVRITAATISFGIESEDWTRHLVALDHVPRGARVAVFATAPCGAPWRMYRLGHLAGLVIERRAGFSNDQFDLRPTALMRVTAPGLRGFALDPSQITMPDACPHAPEFRTLSQALRRFPRDRFDYVWLLTPPPLEPRLLRGLAPIWSGGGDRLLRVASPLSPGGSPA